MQKAKCILGMAFASALIVVSTALSQTTCNPLTTCKTMIVRNFLGRIFIVDAAGQARVYPVSTDGGYRWAQMAPDGNGIVAQKGGTFVRFNVDWSSFRSGKAEPLCTISGSLEFTPFKFYRGDARRLLGLSKTGGHVSVSIVDLGSGRLSSVSYASDSPRTSRVQSCCFTQLSRHSVFFAP